jgi:predicted dehydrogenase
MIGIFESGAAGVWEGSILMKGYHNSGLGQEWAEVNGSEGTAVYKLQAPNHVLLGKPGGKLEESLVPKRFLAHPDSTRDVMQGAPSTVFRYDLVTEFISAIVEGRNAVPGFDAGARAQAIADAVLRSCETRTWIDVNAAL